MYTRKGIKFSLSFDKIRILQRVNISSCLIIFSVKVKISSLSTITISGLALLWFLAADSKLSIISLRKSILLNSHIKIISKHIYMNMPQIAALKRLDLR